MAESADMALLPLPEVLAIFAIDDIETTEVDDAFALEKKDDNYILHVIVANPAFIIGRGDPLDKEARSRGATLYLPDQRITMFPLDLAEGPMSLSALEHRPVLDFITEFTSNLEIVRFEIRECVARVSRQLTYDEADYILETSEEKEHQYLKLIDGSAKISSISGKKTAPFF